MILQHFLVCEVLLPWQSVKHEVATEYLCFTPAECVDDARLYPWCLGDANAGLHLCSTSEPYHAE